MTKQEIRREVLQRIYDSDDREFFNLSELEDIQKEVGDKILDQELRYLDGKNYIKIKGEYMGSQYLNYSYLALTSDGVDLVEEPDKFNQMFPISVVNISNNNSSNISVLSPNTHQEIKKSLDEETIKALNNLKDALEKKDENKVLGILKGLSRDVLIGLTTEGLKIYLKSIGIQ